MKSDASHNGLEISLEQPNENNLKTVMLACRYLSTHKSKNHTNKIELLGVVGAVEYYKKCQQVLRIRGYCRPKSFNLSPLHT